MAGRKKADTSTTDSITLITTQLREAAKMVNMLGNTEISSQIQQRLKGVFEDIIKDVHKLEMLQDYLLTNSNTRYLVYRDNDVYEATPNEIMKAFINKWERTPRVYQEADIWKNKQDPNA